MTTSIGIAADQAAFLAAIRAAPDDDTRRVVYADWLQEHDIPESECRYKPDPYSDQGKCEKGRIWIGQDNLKWIDCPECHGTGLIGNNFAERAEFIRVQCELAKPSRCVFSRLDACFERRCSLEDVVRTGCKNCRPVAQLRLRSESLIMEHYHQWFPGDLHRFVSTIPPNQRGRESVAGGIWCILRRGFLDTVATSWQPWLNWYERIRDCPNAVLRQVELTTWPDWTWIHQRASDIGRNRGLSEAIEDLRAYLGECFPGHCEYEHKGQTRHHPIQWVLPGDTSEYPEANFEPLFG